MRQLKTSALAMLLISCQMETGGLGNESESDTTGDAAGPINNKLLACEEFNQPGVYLWLDPTELEEFGDGQQLPIIRIDFTKSINPCHDLKSNFLVYSIIFLQYPGVLQEERGLVYLELDVIPGGDFHLQFTPLGGEVGQLLDGSHQLPASEVTRWEIFPVGGSPPPPRAN